ncbi:MAG: hypothetical protein ACREBS_06110 [Nitrososphaerales archaeon]
MDSYDIFSDFEGTIAVPEISYKEWVKKKRASPEVGRKMDEEYEKRMNRVRSERSTESWTGYLKMYSNLLSAEDFKQMALEYSLNPVFLWWCKKFYGLHGVKDGKQKGLNVTVVTRGFAPVARLFFQREDVRKSLENMNIAASKVVGSEPLLNNKRERFGMVKGLQSVVYAKRKYVREGHIMLGDDGEEKEFANYGQFVNLSKRKKIEE